MVVWLGVLVQLLTVGVGSISASFPLLLEPIFSYLSSLDMRVDAYSYYNLLCCVRLISLGGLLFF